MKKTLILIVFAFICIKAQAQSSNGERLVQIETELRAALVSEDYSKAILLKQERTIRIKIKSAVELGNFDEAQHLKNSLSNEPAPVSTAVQSNAKGGTITLVFNKLEKKQAALQLDIVLDGKYLGSLNLKESIVVTNINTGEHQIELFNPAKPNNQEFSFLTDEHIENGGTYTVRVKNLSAKDFLALFQKNKQKN